MTKAFKENDMQDQIVKAEFFLPMRGHVADGTRVPGALTSAQVEQRLASVK